LAELNGLAPGSRRWDADTKTLTDGLMVAQQVPGVRHAADVAFQVTVQRTVTLVFAKAFVAAGSYTIAAASTSEALPMASAQPCILSLGASASAVAISGTATINATGCSVRSNGGVSLTGTASVTAASVYAGSAITTTGTSTVHATKFPNAGAIPDPY